MMIHPLDIDQRLSSVITGKVELVSLLYPSFVTLAVACVLSYQFLNAEIQDRRITGKEGDHPV